MNKSSTSLLVFGVYLIGMGVGFVFMPNTLFGMLNLPPTDKVWSGVVGVLALVLAFYYIRQRARTCVRSLNGQSPQESQSSYSSQASYS